MSLSLDDKLLGEKTHYYCSSSDEGSNDEDNDKLGDEAAGVPSGPEVEPPKMERYSGTCTNVNL